MRYVVKVNGKEYDVEVEKLGGPYQSLTRTTAYVQGVPVAVAPQPVVAPAPVASAPTPAPVAPAPTPAPVSSGSGADVTSPMPGKVFKLIAKPGDSVSEGQVIMILEAMKMENEIVAPQAGVVDTILVKEGDMVETETVLATLK
ncbi:MAG: acetyl-CoA carboxylase biotin carboxyl carrier protein subunit [Peptostreptococcaceae bacterium]|nr:acetyl-CoA carboxylase biotin carboxyl carrier protein subunit [Peptostreptococcaceae bacterium]